MKKILILSVLIFVFALSASAENDYAPVLLGHITTCSGLANGYPADTTNWFYRKQHKAVQYFAYLLFPLDDFTVNLRSKAHLFINPFMMYSGSGNIEGEDNQVFENKWISPSGKIISERIVSWSKSASRDKRIVVDDKEYIPYVFTNHIGVTNMFGEYGQERMPTEKGLYHIKLYLNGKLIAITFFEFKD